MIKQKAKVIRLFVDDYFLGISTDSMVEAEVEFIDVTTKDSGGWREIIPGNISRRIIVKNLTKVMDKGDIHSRILDTYLCRKKVSFELDLDESIFFGDAYIDDMSIRVVKNNETKEQIMRDSVVLVVSGDFRFKK